MSFDLTEFKKSFAADQTSALTDDLWKAVEASEYSLWRCTYDYADDNENLDATKEISNSFMKKAAPCADSVFGVLIVLEDSLEVEGLWLVKGGDPEESLYAKCEDTSWFSWSQLGPKITDGVKAEITALWCATDDYKGKKVADKQTLS